MYSPPLTPHYKLEWTGEYLGEFNRSIIIYKWTYVSTEIHHLRINNESIYCIMELLKDNFPCIIEDIKNVFKLSKRGYHTLKIDGRMYIIYYVPLTSTGVVIWETPVYRLNLKDPLRSDPNFRKKMQRLLVFCDVMALYQTSESNIHVRPRNDGTFSPINYNLKTTNIIKGDNFSIITKNVYRDWFGETVLVEDVAKEFVNYTEKTNLTELCFDLRNKIEDIIRKHDKSYLWYSKFIIERLSRYLLQ